MSLVSKFDDDGLLRPGRELRRTDEKVVLEPWPATIAEVIDVMGQADRARTAEHLSGFVSWWSVATRSDPRAELWVTGRFGCTLHQSVEDLDLIVFHDYLRMSPGNTWALARFASGGVRLHPGRLSVRRLPVGGDAYDRDREAVRARVSAHDQVTGDPYVTGWIQIVDEEEESSG